MALHEATTSAGDLGHGRPRLAIVAAPQESGLSEEDADEGTKAITDARDDEMDDRAVTEADLKGVVRERRS